MYNDGVGSFIVCSTFCLVIAWCTMLIKDYVILMALCHISLHDDAISAYCYCFDAAAICRKTVIFKT